MAAHGLAEALPVGDDDDDAAREALNGGLEESGSAHEGRPGDGVDDVVAADDLDGEAGPVAGVDVQRHANLGLLGEGKRFPGSDLAVGGAGTGKDDNGKRGDGHEDGDEERRARAETATPPVLARQTGDFFEGNDVAPIGHVFLLMTQGFRASIPCSGRIPSRHSRSIAGGRDSFCGRSGAPSHGRAASPRRGRRGPCFSRRRRQRRG